VYTLKKIALLVSTTFWSSYSPRVVDVPASYVSAHLQRKLQELRAHELLQPHNYAVTTGEHQTFQHQLSCYCKCYVRNSSSTKNTLGKNRLDVWLLETPTAFLSFPCRSLQSTCLSFLPAIPVDPAVWMLRTLST